MNIYIAYFRSPIETMLRLGVNYERRNWKIFRFQDFAFFFKSTISRVKTKYKKFKFWRFFQKFTQKMVIFDEKLEFLISKIYILTTFWQLNLFSPPKTNSNQLKKPRSASSTAFYRILPRSPVTLFVVHVRTAFHRVWQTTFSKLNLNKFHSLN